MYNLCVTFIQTFPKTNLINYVLFKKNTVKISKHMIGLILSIDYNYTNINYENLQYFDIKSDLLIFT